MNESISILISNWNGQEALYLTVESILLRTDYPNYNILVLDSSGEGSQDRNYLKEKEREGKLKLLTTNTQCLHDNAIPRLLKHCLSQIAVILDSDVMIRKNGRDWLHVLTKPITSRYILGIARTKGKGCIESRKSYTAPTYQPFCMALNMIPYRKIEGKIHWQHESIKIKDYKGKSAFTEYKKDFNCVFGDVGYKLAEYVLFDNTEGLHMLPLPLELYSKITHWGGMSSCYHTPEHPRVRTKWLMIKEELRILRNEYASKHSN